MRRRELRELRRQAKRELIAESEQLLAETQAQELRDYNRLRKWKWWHLVCASVLLALGISLSFLVGFLTKNSIKAPDWQGTSWFALAWCSGELLVWLILGWIRNQQAVRFYKNRRYRYRLTYQLEEVKIRIARRIILTSWLPLTLFTGIVLFIF